jgi:hypothetical protein
MSFLLEVVPRQFILGVKAEVCMALDERLAVQNLVTEVSVSLK